ncbi:MAG: hypothetical protein ACRDAO_05635 [Culicoidibacterales bacterium]
MIFFWTAWLLFITYLLYGKQGEIAKQKGAFTLSIVLTGLLLLVNISVATLNEQLIIVVSTVFVAFAPIIKNQYFNISRWCVLLPAILAYLLL